MKRVAILLGLTLALAASQRATAEELTPEKALKAWAMLKGDWNSHSPDGNVADVAIRMAANESCFVIESAQYHGIFTFDGAEKKMLAVGSHAGGVISRGHWLPAGEGIIEGKFTITLADGAKSDHTGKFEAVSDNEIKYTIDAADVYTFKRK